jgi:hypothetical protein
MIVAQEPTESPAAADGPVCARWREAFRRNEPIVNPLVIPFLVVVGQELCERPAQVGFAEDDDPIQAFLLDRPDESLRVRIAVGRFAPQCARRNVCHEVGRSGTGRRPCAFRIRAIVDRPTRCPRFLSAPRIRVAPGGILSRHPHDEPPDLHEYARTTVRTLRVRPLACDELPLPPEHRVGGDDRGDLTQ